MSLLPRTILGLATVVVLSASGCGTSASSLCRDICDCQGCSEVQEQDCVDDIEDVEKNAEDEGCADQADELLSCYGDQLECREGNVDADGCDAENDALNNCIGGRSSPSPRPGRGVGGSLCDAAADICSAGEGSSGEDEFECSGSAECVSRCVVDADSCDFNDEDLASCVNDCNGDTSPEE